MVGTALPSVSAHPWALLRQRVWRERFMVASVDCLVSELNPEHPQLLLERPHDVDQDVL